MDVAAVSPPDLPHPAAPETDARIGGLLARVAVLEAEVARLHAAVGTLEDLERYRDVILARHGQRPGPALAADCAIDASEFIAAGAGFHFLEYGDDGTAYRWTGPGAEARLSFWMDRSRPIAVRVFIRDFGAVARGTAIPVEVDGVAFPGQVQGDGGMVVAGPVPPRAAPGPTCVVLRSPALFCPAAAGGEDDRMLGLAVMRVELGPA